MLTLGRRSFVFRVGPLRIKHGGRWLGENLAEADCFSGEARDCHDWKFVFAAWIFAPIPEMDARLIQAGDEELRFDGFTEDAKRFSSKMMGVQVGLAQGKALRIVQGAPRARNGFEAWRVLVHTFEADAPVRSMVMLSSVLNFDFKGPDFRDKLVEWENVQVNAVAGVHTGTAR